MTQTKPLPRLLAPGIRIELFQVAGGGFTTVAVRTAGLGTTFTRSIMHELPQLALFAELCETHNAQVQA